MGSRVRGLMVVGMLAALSGILPVIAQTTDLSARGRARYQAVLQRGCSERWAQIEAPTADMSAQDARYWLKYRGGSRLHDAVEEIDYLGGHPKEQEAAARGALADWRCGAATGAEEDLFTLMLALGGSLQQQRRLPEAEQAISEARNFANKTLPARLDLRAEASRQLAEVLEARSEYARAAALRKEALELTQRGPSAATPSIRRLEKDINILMGLKQRVDPMIRLGQFDAAESAARYSLDEADRRSVPDDEVTAQVLLKLAEVLNRETKYAAAEPLLQRMNIIAFADAGRRREWLQAARTEAITSLIGQRRFAEATEPATQQLTDAKRDGSAERLVAANQSLGDLLMRQDRWREAEVYYRAAIAPAEKIGIDAEWYSTLRYSQGVALRLEGKFDESATLLRDLIDRDGRRAGIVQGKLPAEFFGSEGRAPSGYAASAPAFTHYAKDLTALSAALSGQGKFEEARSLAERALDISVWQIAAENVFDPDVHQVEVRRSREDAARYLLPALWGLDRQGGRALAPGPKSPLAQAFEAAQYVTNSAAGEALIRVGVQWLANAKGMSADLQARDALRARVESANGEDLMRATRSGTDALEGHLRAKRELDTARVALMDNTRRLHQAFPDFWDLMDPSVISLSELQGVGGTPEGLLHSDEALLLVLQSPAGVFVFALSTEAAAWYKAPVASKELDRWVSQLRCSADARHCVGEQGRSGGFDRQTAYKLYTTLLGSASIQRVIGSRHSILFVSNAALTSLPLGLLVTQSPKGDDADPATLRQTPWLMKDKAIAVLPNVASLKTLRRVIAQAPVKGPYEPFLGFAPRFPGSSSTGRALPKSTQSDYADGKPWVEQIRSLPPLSGDREMAALGIFLGAPEDAVFLGERATKEAVLSLDGAGRLAQARVIAFATHALVSGDFGLAEPALALTPPSDSSAISARNDGLLKASDIAMLHLHADWVVLSACNTGAGETPEAEGLSGLARAFMLAGAKSLIVSHWAVSDEAARRLITRTFDLQRQDARLPRAEALRRAELELLQDSALDDSVAPNSSPAVWAPFVVIGAD